MAGAGGLLEREVQRATGVEKWTGAGEGSRPGAGGSPVSAAGRPGDAVLCQPV